MNFGRVDAVILDFYHATEYLGTLSRAIHPDNESERSAQSQSNRRARP